VALLAEVLVYGLGILIVGLIVAWGYMCWADGREK